ncbi:hypothetical protein Y032_0068g275 [Ancylostoma ceylanicum]|uniref:Nudix hydrolase domain-containing protein n=1 Tax=Ancylostoma ceylanicum TaxID=53326 RepID=A0A016TZ35_9BILA|nr:hypothetical protein Y032_0068g275 [Ancylostoma ceylanicum]
MVAAVAAPRICCGRRHSQFVKSSVVVTTVKFRCPSPTERMRSSLTAIGNVTKEQFLKKLAEKNAVPWHPRLAAAESDMSVLVPLLEVNSKPSVLFTKRSIHLKSHRGEVCFPGGRMEKEETVEEAALRETHEEIGVEPKSVEVWGRLKPVLTRTLTNTVVPIVGCLDKEVLKPDLVNKKEVINSCSL